MNTDTEIKASREPADNSYGQNGSPEASSLLPGETKPNIKNVSPPTVTVPDSSWQTRDVGRSGMKAHSGMHDPSKVLDRVPATTQRRAIQNTMRR